MKDEFMRKIIRWIDLKLEKYREKTPEKKLVVKNEHELVKIIKETPEKVLSAQEKNMIAAVLSFSSKRAYDIMIPENEMTYVREDEVLGPLILDKLYKSGFSHFPVVDKLGKIVGIIHTESLNSLEIKEAKKAKDLIFDKKVTYVRYDEPLEKILDEFMRTNVLFYLVVDEKEKLVGMITFEMVIYYLLGKI